ncbi:hypothetical protein J6TS1_27290 [Siminovitchia terrae]|uniref:Glycosyltransferase 2-like domain-containing protein n=1 Tax=Siminovitchia terrae TaxID=1914933 RepID=A0ABQ4KXY3_SIMTE|nr:glycosyltransferase family 2 protein [Siminovitchia terrae]GIN96859.1 hypothetical protein J6TS1_27290 [Siminovitchia terrae]
MKKYSVIIPCYNLESVIHRTIKSVLEQTYNNFELIIVDDGSTDNTLEVLKGYQLIDSRLKVFSKENGGVSAARNFGLQKCSGEYILFLDGDDLIERDLLQRADSVFNNKVDMFSFGYKKVNITLNKIEKSYSYKKYNEQIFTGSEFQKLFFSKKISQCMCSFIIRKDIIVENFILFDENTKYGEDQEFQLRCNVNCQKIYYESMEYFLYVQRDGSAINNKVVRENFDVYFRMREYINQELERYYNNFLCYLFVYLIKEIREKGSDKKTVKKLLQFDGVLRNYSIDATYHNILTGIFIIFYKFYYKKRIIKSFDL